MADATTPMMRQYRRVKAELSEDVILFFRLGDFYEMFFDDAKTASAILEIALTRRNGVPMCGVPYHSVDSYLGKLIRAGKKVAICDQLEDPASARGIVRRDVTRVVTPGTVTEDGMLDAGRHSFLAALLRDGDRVGLCLLDLSTGLFWGEEADAVEGVRNSLRRCEPRECVVPAGQAADPMLREAASALPSVHVTSAEDWTFEYETARDALRRHFGVQSLEGFGCEGRRAVVGAAGGMFHYVKEDLRRQVGHIRSFRMESSGENLVIDEATATNLDLAGARGRPDANTLLAVLDTSRTAMGARKLRDWILRPPAKREAIVERHEAVAALLADRMLLSDLREALSGVRDLERLVARISSGGGNARDVASVGSSVARFPDVRGRLAACSSGLLQRAAEAVEPMPDLVDRIARAIVDAPPTAVKEGGMIRDGYCAELDELRRAGSAGRQWLAEYQAREQSRTGIKNLKVRHNQVFGYYIEVSRGQVGLVPSDYTRKQTLVGAERFITPELKEYETRILGAQDKAVALEYELFLQLREGVLGQMERLQRAANAVATADVLATFAERALSLRYVRPTITDGDAIRIKAGRHPVVERMPESERFVPNDTVLDGRENQLIIITGPNMAGKSTYIRQVAVIVIMAQAGSFVPADEAEIGVVDRVFTRVGASDDLARGRSTFMVEMQETANILNNATARSLIVLDEIGRGTSTFDGISIAWAVAEYLHNEARVKAKTLFATHYHELTDLALTMEGVQNYNVLVRESGDRVVFLRRIVPGGSDKSYGIEVARLAGMPSEVVDRAREILANLEEGELGDSGQPKIAQRRRRRERDAARQLTLFGDP